MAQQKNNSKSLGMYLASLLIVGTVGLVRRMIPLPSGSLAFFRGLIGAGSLLAYTAVRRKRRREKLTGKKLTLLLLTGAFLGLNWMLLFEAYNHTTIAKATLCYYLQPTIVLLLSPLLFREKLGARKLICAAMALLGMVFVSGVIGGDGAAAADGKGILFGLAAACFYSMVVIFNKKIADVEVYEKTILQLLAAAIVLLPYLLATGQLSGLVMDARTLLLLLVLGVVYTGLVYALYFGSMDGLRAQTISMLSYLDPVVALLASVLVLRETLTPIAAVGAVLILGSAILSEWEPGAKVLEGKKEDG